MSSVILDLDDELDYFIFTFDDGDFEFYFDRYHYHISSNIIAFFYYDELIARLTINDDFDLFFSKLKGL